MYIVIETRIGTFLVISVVIMVKWIRWLCAMRNNKFGSTVHSCVSSDATNHRLHLNQKDLTKCVHFSAFIVTPILTSCGLAQ